METRTSWKDHVEKVKGGNPDWMDGDCTSFDPPPLLGLRRLRCVRVLPSEAIYAPGDIHNFVFARVKRVTLRADVGREAPARRMSNDHGAASAGDGRVFVGG